MSNASVGRITVGTANWSDHSGFYLRGTKPAERLAYYASRLRVVEVNASFYRRIDPSVYGQWAEQTPEAFTFLVKAHRAVANPPRDPQLASEYIANQFKGVQPLREAGKFGGFLVQLGVNVRPKPETYAHLALLRDGMGDDPIAIELRHPAWLGEMRAETLERMRALGLGAVIADEPRAAVVGLPKPVDELTAPALAYYRFMGRDNAGKVSARERRALRAEHAYTDLEIGELADLVSARHGPETASYVIFYNKKGPNRVEAAMRMAAELERRGYSIRQ
ncbi:MAG: DUF72 domain-containing protein [Chloroflexota bacterium]|nr:DUF72 domain-containing protein [Chloroflexota bacterium]MDE2920681.1 DUF72 domain-containing protein [Chloroflexota bacterium]